jgi:hypothetical protein
MGKLVGAAALGVMALVMGLVLVVAVVAGASGSDATSSGSAAGISGPTTGGTPSGAAIPSGWLSLYQQAAATCPGLSWSVLAAIGTVETDSGQSNALGVWSETNDAGAEGPMQFELPMFIRSTLSHNPLTRDYG